MRYAHTLTMGLASMFVLAVCFVPTSLFGADAEEKSPTTAPSDRAMSASDVMPAEAHVIYNPQDSHAKWTATPPSLPAGGQMLVLDGDPGKPELFTLRIKSPAGYTIAPHWHPTAEHVTVISGALYVGDGDKIDKAHAAKLPAGGYVALPPHMHHYAYSDEDTVIQIHGMGPFVITYVNPADDPRTKTHGE